MKKNGIILVAIGSKGYAYMAANLAYSIKRFSPDVNVALLCDSVHEYLQPEYKDVFDEIIPVKNEDCHSEGRLDPAKLKIRIYDYLPYKGNLYLDVDALVIKDIRPLIDGLDKDGRFYITQKEGEGGHEDHIPYSIWTANHHLVEYFNVPKSNNIVSIQSSWAYIKKGKKASDFFKKLRGLYDKGFPVEKLTIKWGGGYPDELFYSGLVSHLGLDIAFDQSVIYFGHRGNTLTRSEIEKEYYVLSMYGNANGNSMTILRYWELYDQLLDKWMRRDRKQGKSRKEHIYKGSQIKQYKHANNNR